MFNVKLVLTAKGIGIRHLSNCTRELAGDAARVFAKDAPIGAVLTIVKVETVHHAEVTRANGKVEPARVEIVETVCAKATRQADAGFWRAEVGQIVGVTCDAPSPKASEADALRAQVEAARAENARLRAAHGLPVPAAPPTAPAPSPEPIIAGAPVLSSLLQ